MMPSWPQMLIVLAIFIIIFGGKRITDLLGDTGKGIKAYKEATKGEADD